MAAAAAAGWRDIWSLKSSNPIMSVYSARLWKKMPRLWSQSCVACLKLCKTGCYQEGGNCFVVLFGWLRSTETSWWFVSELSPSGEPQRNNECHWNRSNSPAVAVMTDTGCEISDSKVPAMKFHPRVPSLATCIVTYNDCNSINSIIWQSLVAICQYCFTDNYHS